MIYAQVAGGQRLHMVCVAGEEFRGDVIRRGTVSMPLCGRPVPPDGYRMTINVPMASACRNCLRVYRAGRFQEPTP